MRKDPNNMERRELIMKLSKESCEFLMNTELEKSKDLEEAVDAFERVFLRVFPYLEVGPSSLCFFLPQSIDASAFVDEVGRQGTPYFDLIFPGVYENAKPKIWLRKLTVK